MHVSPLQHLPVQDLDRTNSLRKAASAAAPPKLTDEEARMIHKEFADVKQISFYRGNGEMQHQTIASRGRHIDTLI
jgi:exonuclease III